jgi:hypothetical protein
VNLEAVRPLIVPAEYVTAGVPAVFDTLLSPNLVLTWVELPSDGAMVYVTPSRAAKWDRIRPGWRTAALDVMRRTDAGRPWTHEKRRTDGALEWVAMMHDDGLGSSRLLFEPELQRTFPAGYLVALPDRSCGMAIAQDADLAEVRRMIARMHADATTPMIADVLEARELRPAAA